MGSLTPWPRGPRAEPALRRLGQGAQDRRRPWTGVKQKTNVGLGEERPYSRVSPGAGRRGDRQMLPPRDLHARSGGLGVQQRGPGVGLGWVWPGPVHLEVPWGRIIARSSRKDRSSCNSEKLSKASLGLAAPQGTKFKVPGPRFKGSQMRMGPQVPVTGLVLWAGLCPPIHTLKPYTPSVTVEGPARRW